MNDYMEQFLSEIVAAGLPRPDKITADGTLHRFATNGKHGDDSGWYCLHTDNIPAGAFGCWRTGVSRTWRANVGRDMTPAESQAHRKQMDAINAARKADEIKRHADAAIRASLVWEAAQPASENHPYTVRKAVAVYGLREHKGQLVVPMRDTEGALHSLQFIAPDGQKRFLTAGRVKACFHMIGQPDATLCVAEGWATAATVHAAIGHAVAVAFNAGNMEPVARALRAKYPKVKIIICGDTDHSGVGQKAAQEAARAIGGSVALPEFSAIEMTAEKPPSDWNDLAALRGLGAVKAAINAVLSAAASLPCVAEGPQPLLREIRLGAAYPVDALGPLRGAVEAVQGQTLAPEAIPAASALAVASLAVMGFADVQTLGGPRPVSLYVLTVAQSGERKSSCDAPLMAALRAHEKEQAKDQRAETESWNSTHALWRGERDRILGEAKKGKGEKRIASEADLRALGAEPAAPPSPDRVVTEPTYEGLTRLFAHGQPALGIFSDEGGQFLGGFAMSTDNRQKTLAALNDLWQGNPIRRTRQGEGSFTLYGRRLAVHLMVQPGVARAFMADPMATDTGFLCRFLICEPPSTIGTRLHAMTRRDSAGLADFSARLRDVLETPLPMDPETRELTPRVLALSPGAWALLVKFSDAIEAAQAAGGDLAHVTGYASKAAEQACRIAGVLTLWGDLNASEVAPAAMANGIKLAQFYLSEASRLADSATVSAEIANAEALRKWLLVNWQHPEILTRDVLRLAPIRALRESPKARSALGLLEKHGWIVPLDPGTVVRGAPRKEAWRIVRGAGDVV